MAGKTLGNGKDKEGVREMDELFRRADFAAESPGLAERLREKIRRRLPAQDLRSEMLREERELSESELSGLAAAGAPGARAANAIHGNDPHWKK